MQQVHGMHSVCLFCQVLPFKSSSFSMDCTWNFRLQNALKSHQQEFTDITPAVEGRLIFPSQIVLCQDKRLQKTLQGEVTCFFSGLAQCCEEPQEAVGAGFPYLAPAKVAAGCLPHCRELLLQVPGLLLDVLRLQRGCTVNGELETKAQLYSRDRVLYPHQLLHLNGFFQACKPSVSSIWQTKRLRGIMNFQSSKLTLLKCDFTLQK